MRLARPRKSESLRREADGESTDPQKQYVVFCSAGPGLSARREARSDLGRARGQERSQTSVPIHLCEVTTEVVGVTGAGVMLMSGDVPQGSLCTTNSVSSLIEELQYTLGEGRCTRPRITSTGSSWSPIWPTRRCPGWLAFVRPALEAGVRGVFGFPLRVGSARLGALNLYHDRPGELSTEQHADALVTAEVIAHWVLDTQASTSTRRRGKPARIRSRLSLRREQCRRDGLGPSTG